MHRVLKLYLQKDELDKMLYVIVMYGVATPLDEVCEYCKIHNLEFEIYRLDDRRSTNDTILEVFRVDDVTRVAIRLKYGAYIAHEFICFE